MGVEFRRIFPKSLLWTGEEFLAIALEADLGTQSIYRSYNGVQWEKLFSNDDELWNAVIATSNGIIAVGKSGSIYNNFCKTCITTSASYNETTQQLLIPTVRTYNNNAELVTYSNVILEQIQNSQPMLFVLRTIGQDNDNIQCPSESSILDIAGTLLIPTVDVISNQITTQSLDEIFLQVSSEPGTISAELMSVGE